jgi:hypothetical protein
MVEQLQPRQHLSGTPHERLQQRELLRGELDLRVAAPGSAGRRIEPEVADDELGRPLDAATANECPQAREQLGQRERLSQVGVGAGVEPGDAILDGVAGGEHQHGRPHAVVPKPPARLEAAQAREHDVENDRVVRMRAHHPHGVLAPRGDVRRVSFLDEPAPDEAGHPRLVLDDQDAHRLRSSGYWMRAR